MFIQRKLSSLLQKSRKSLLVLGPRQTGKSTLIRHLQPDLEINLADEQTYLEFARNPSELTQRLGTKKFKTIFIDEIQRLPSLLHTIQSLLDRRPQILKFYLTGSSARKLRRGHANLLPGRIHTFDLGPLAASELNYSCRFPEVLETGTLPGIYTESSMEEKTKTLRSYASTYLKEEIQAEALTRNLEGFSRFLFFAAENSGKFLDVSKLSSEAQIPRPSATRYFEILEDTLIVNRCLPFTRSTRKRLIQHPKYFFFDNGVWNALLGNFSASSDRIGNLFEHLFFNQILAEAKAMDRNFRISTYRTEHGAEVDFIIELGNACWAVEIKASRQVGPHDLRGLKNFKEFYRKPHHSVVAYLGDVEKIIEGISILPWQKLISQMGF
jgi:predicted AAA+ superfamily ATPase